MNQLAELIQGATLIADVVLLAFIIRQQSSLLRNLFAIHVAFVALWTTFVFLTIQFGTPPYMHLVFAFAAAALTAQFLFIRAFPDVTTLHRASNTLIASIGAAFAVMSFVPYGVFKTFTIAPDGYAVIENGSLSAPYSLFVVAYIVAPTIVLWRRMRSTQPGTLREQLKYLFIGFSAFLGINLFTNSVLPVFFHIYVFNAIGPVFSLVLAVAVFYIIYRHRFLDIRVVLERGLVYILLVTLVTGTYFGALPWLLRSAIPFGIASPLLAFALFLASGAVIYGVERYFERARLLARERAYAEELEKKVAERTEHLEELQAYQRRMVGDISHALQTPLTVLTSAVENLKRDSDVPENDVALASQSIERLSQLMYALLRLSKLEALPAESHERFSLSAAVSDIAEYIETVCQERGITLTRHIEPDIKMAGDQAQIEELLTNLLSNAVRYTQRSAKREIALTLQRRAGEIDMAVADTGSGIPADSLPHLFERFYRAPNNTEPGTGLGLAIVKRIAELHGGTISVESTEGHGATFTVRFPAA